MRRVVPAVHGWATRHDDVRGLLVVGSWARDRARMDSDVDILVLTDTAHSRRRRGAVAGGRKPLALRVRGDHHGRMATDLTAHYGSDRIEDSRLSRSPHGRLEYLRTRELIRRHLPAPGARILDIGGGTGVHAAWLAADGHAVHVVDVVPAHAEAAAALPGVTAEVGDARHLGAADASTDVVLLLGPLYHLREPGERARALAEARRVLRPGGLLVAAAISRYLTLLEFGTDGRLSADLQPPVADVIATGRYDGHAGFVPAHFHTAAELRTEVVAAGLRDVTVYGVEGPAWPALDTAGLGAFDDRVDAALRCARLVEEDPLLINASAHLLAAGRR